MKREKLTESELKDSCLSEALHDSLFSISSLIDFVYKYAYNNRRIKQYLVQLIIIQFSINRQIASFLNNAVEKLGEKEVAEIVNNILSTIEKADETENDGNLNDTNAFIINSIKECDNIK